MEDGQVSVPWQCKMFWRKKALQEKLLKVCPGNLENGEDLVGEWNILLNDAIFGKKERRNTNGKPVLRFYHCSFIFCSPVTSNKVMHILSFKLCFLRCA